MAVFNFVHRGCVYLCTKRYSSMDVYTFEQRFSCMIEFMTVYTFVQNGQLYGCVYL